MMRALTRFLVAVLALACSTSWAGAISFPPGLGSGSASSTYLKLDGSNGPMTGALAITPATDVTVLTLTRNTATTNALVELGSLVTQSTGTPAIGLGGFLRFVVETAVGVNTNAAFIGPAILTTGGTPTFAMHLGVSDVERLRVVDTGTQVNPAAFSSSIAAYGSVNDPDTGVFYLAANSVQLAAGGAGNAVNLTTTETRFTQPLRSASVTCTAAVPCFSDVSDTNTGMNLPGADVLTLSTAGATAVSVESDQVTLLQPVVIASADQNPRGRLHVVATASSGTSGPSILERSTSSTTGTITSMVVQSTSTGAMTDGFSSQLGFTIRDNSGVDNRVANVRASRVGADTTASLIFQTSVSGTDTDRLTVSNLGAQFELATSIAAGECDAAAELGTVKMFRKGGTQTTMCVCAEVATVIAWAAATAGGDCT